MRASAARSAWLPPTSASSEWISRASARIEPDFQRSADTHLIALPLPGFAAARIDLYLKDESTHPTGSLKQPLTAVSELRAFRG